MSSDILGIYVWRVGLKLKIASNIKFSLLGCLSTTVLAVPKCHSLLKVTPFYSISCFSQTCLSLFFRRSK